MGPNDRIWTSGRSPLVSVVIKGLNCHPKFELDQHKMFTLQITLCLMATISTSLEYECQAFLLVGWVSQTQKNVSKKLS